MQLSYRFVLTVLALLMYVPGSAASEAPMIKVLKSPTCGCCVKWMEHLHENGFATTPDEPDDLEQIKDELGIGQQYRSCHTGVSKQGFVFEGHVPSKFIRAFLASPPKGAIGLSVPGMPLGSPGMEVGDRFTTYQVLLLHKDGSSDVFAEVNAPGEQFQQ